MVDSKRALVVGVTGISGNNTARQLLAEGWEVHGLSRSGTVPEPGIRPVAADLLDAAATRRAVADLRPSHVFYCTWQRRATEAENCEVNAAMMTNLLEPLGETGGLAHVALVTGLKHYLGPFEAYARTPMETPFREEQPRLPNQNFYYAQEDVLFEAAERSGFTWSVHRPHTLIGWALGNAMNMGVTLAVYGALSRETGEPFVFPGSPEQFNGVTDVTDARLLAKQLVWAASTPEAWNQAFNAVNGDVFRWRQLWPVLADGLGVPPAQYPGHAQPLADRLAAAGPVWDRIVEKHGLVPTKLEELASWWHTDGDLGRETETFADMTKSRSFGFTVVQDTRRSFLDLFERLRAERIIPPLG
ncbi:SDR family oxidoreductase [Pseudonocardia xinjiangensis]|uniref:SDR family oxidoreductase n=1 Tax=Pseudonocardia xinjiangensis TaxID=75289 RepID=UPI003D8A4094